VLFQSELDEDSREVELEVGVVVKRGFLLWVAKKSETIMGELVVRAVETERSNVSFDENVTKV